MSENLKRLAKLFGTAARAPSGGGASGGASVNPNYWARPMSLQHFSRGQGKPGKPTGTYPKNWFKGGHPGNIAINAAKAGIAPPIPNTTPSPSVNFGTQTGGPTAMPAPPGSKH